MGGRQCEGWARRVSHSYESWCIAVWASLVKGIQIRRRKQRSTYFPRELVKEVLVRLPVKSLARFKCVCKEWFTLIGDPQFAKSHLELSLPAAEGGIIYEKYNYMEHNGEFIFTVSYVDLDVERGVVSNFDFNVREIVGNYSLSLHDSCNGLLLLRKFLPLRHRFNTEYLVCNPITHRYLTLPRFHYSNPLYIRRISLSYDGLNQKYKVLIVFRDSDRISYRCAVCTVGNISESWRVMDIPVTSGEISPAMHPINGAIYWMIPRTPWPRPPILRMDLGSEEFSLIDGPPTISGDYATIHKVNGSLCLAVSVSSHQLELWVLNDAVKQTWSKEFSINFRSVLRKFDLYDLHDRRQLFITGHPRPLIIFFGFPKKHFLLYDLFTGQFKVANTNIGMRQFSFKLAHVNSFISF